MLARGWKNGSVDQMHPFFRVFDLSFPLCHSSLPTFFFFLIYVVSSGLSCSPWDLHCLTWILPCGTWTLVEMCGLSCPDAWKILVPRPEIEPMSLTLPGKFFFFFN